MNALMKSVRAWTLAVAAALVTSGCGGGPTGPSSTGNTTPASNAVTVMGCSSLGYRGQTLPASCSIPGQSAQPSGFTMSFPGRTDCINVTCANGCVRTATAGTLSGSTCS
jgi:hypothetical protein